MSQDVKAKVDELFTLYENEFKSAAKEAKAEVAKFGQESAEVKSKLDKMQERMDVLEKEANDLIKQAKSAPKDEKSEADRYTELFVKNMFTKGLKGSEKQEFEQLQAKAMQTDIAEDGGVLLPVNMERRVIEKIYESSPIVELAASFTISEGDSLSIPREGADITLGGWAANERYTVAESAAPKFELLTIPVHELWAEPRVTQKMLEDSAIAVEAYVQRKAQDRFNRDINTAMYNGSGVAQPRGFVTNLASAQIVNSGSNTAFDADDLITLAHALKTDYARNATWGFSRLTRAYIRKFTAADDNYLWQPGLQQGSPALLLGLPYREFNDMDSPNASTNNFATSANAVVLADWNRFYGVVRKRGMRIVRDELTSKPFVKYWMSLRIGGDRLLDEAGVLLRTVQ